MVKLARKVLKNSIFNSLRALISGIGGFVFSVVLARLLTPEQFGIYALTMSICFFVMQFDPGTSYTMIRYVSYSIGRRDFKSARAYFYFLLKIRVLFLLVSSTLLFLLAKVLAYNVFNKPELSVPLQIAAFLLFAIHFSGYFDDLCFAFQNFKYPAIKQLIYEISRFTFVIPFLLMGFFYGIFVGLVLSSIFALLIILPFVLKRFPIRGETSKIDKRRVLRFMAFISVGSLSAVFFNYIDIIMIGMFLPADDAGYYKVATNLIFAVLSLMGISQVLFPVFTQLEGDNLENAFKKVFKYSLVFSLPFAILLAHFSREIVSVIYGSKYIKASIALTLLTPIIVFNAVNLFGTLFGAKEKPQYGTAVSTVSATMNVILNYFLIQFYGIAGAAVATTLSRLFNVVVLGYLCSKVLGIRPDASSIYKPLIASLIMALFVYLSPQPEMIFFGLVEVVLAFLIYFATIFAVRGLDKNDLRYFRMVVGI